MGEKCHYAMRFLLAIVCLLLPLLLPAEIKQTDVDGIEFAYRIPEKIGKDSRIMVLFGGRNWHGDKALKTFNFDALADRYSLILLSPSFKDNEYWQPEKWSGKILLKAIERLKTKFNLSNQKLLFYGYSAGGQCSNLFYNYIPKQVEAWGLHACGVYPQVAQKNGVPAFITCGMQDADRVRISKAFIYKYRESGGSLIWKPYNGGHELNKEALEFARQFFDDILSKHTCPIYIGEDETGIVVPAKNASEIDVEFRNPLYSETLKKLWEAQ